MDAQTKVKYIYTASHYYCFIACGLCFSIFNPTLIDLKDIFNTSLRQASFAFPIRSAGYVIGTLSCGVVSTIFNRQLVLIILLILKSGTIALVPHWSNVYQFYVNAVFNGFFTAGIDTTVNVWVNEMWDTNGGPYMQALHFFFGIGSILGPILSEPFLSPTHTNETNFNLIYDKSEFNYLEIFELKNSTDNTFKSKLYIPYSISAISAVISSVIYLLLFIFCRYQPPQTNEANDDRQQLVNNQSPSSSISKFKCPDCSTIWVISISSVFLLIYAGTETAYFQFSASFATQTDLHLSKNTGAYMASVLALSFTITRAFSILIAIKIPAQYMIYMDCLILLSGNIVIFLFANNNENLLWAGNILIGIGFASVFPSFYPFIEKHLKITNLIGSILLFSAGLSSCLCPLIVGLFIEKTPFMLIYLNFSFTIITIINVFVLQITFKIRAKASQQNVNQISESQESEEVPQT